MLCLVISVQSLIIASSSCEEIIIPTKNLHGHTKEQVCWLSIEESESSNLYTTVTEDTTIVSRVMLASSLVVVRVVGSGPRTSTLSSESTILVIVDSPPGILIVADSFDGAIESDVSEPNSPRSGVGCSRVEAMRT
jgi:hypothetical protein